jgi:ketosteroid isomerase-like protein
MGKYRAREFGTTRNTRVQGTTSRRTREGILVASGAAVLLVALLVLQSILGSGLFSTKTVTVTLTASDPYEQVASAYATHLEQLRARNISAIPSGYKSNATVEWTGVDPGMNGNYSGAGNIKILWGSFIGKFTNFSLSNEYQSIQVDGDFSVVNSTFDFRGYDSAVGMLNGSVVAQDVYENAGGSWLIVRETWNFIQFNGQIPTVIG